MYAQKVYEEISMHIPILLIHSVCILRYTVSWHCFVYWEYNDVQGRRVPPSVEHNYSWKSDNKQENKTKEIQSFEDVLNCDKKQHRTYDGSRRWGRGSKTLPGAQGKPQCKWMSEVRRNDKPDIRTTREGHSPGRGNCTSRKSAKGGREGLWVVKESKGGWCG